jgi:hypothetical protein
LSEEKIESFQFLAIVLIGKLMHLKLKPEAEKAPKLRYQTSSKGSYDLTATAMNIFTYITP